MTLCKKVIVLLTESHTSLNPERINVSNYFQLNFLVEMHHVLSACLYFKLPFEAIEGDI